MQKLYVGMNHTKALISEGFYNFAQERRQMKDVEKSPKKQYSHSSQNDIIQRLSPIIPKVCSFICINKKKLRQKNI